MSRPAEVLRLIVAFVSLVLVFGVLLAVVLALQCGVDYLARGQHDETHLWDVLQGEASVWAWVKVLLSGADWFNRTTLGLFLFMVFVAAFAAVAIVKRLWERSGRKPRDG